MLTYLKVKNYKSLHNTEIRFTDFTVLVGNNASGKSSVLQVIDFMTRSVREDYSYILEQRGYAVSDVLSKFAPPEDQTISLYSEWNFFVNGREQSIGWEMEIACNIQENSMRLFRERIFDLKRGMDFLYYGAMDSEKALTVGEPDGKRREYPHMPLTSSAMKVALDTSDETEQQNLPILVTFKKYLTSSCSYDLLSPDEMRQSSRGFVTSIGPSGRDLPAFIKSMKPLFKMYYMDKLHQLLGEIPLETVEARSEGRPGWTRLEAYEKYGEKTVAISSVGMSDGMLRLLAFVAISEAEAIPCLMLMDEIENGININYAKKLVQILKEACDTKHQQMIVTTHSTVFLDYVEAKDIVFLRRNGETGCTEAIGMLQIPGILKRLEYLYPGEVLLNMTKKERAELMLTEEMALGEDEDDG